MLKRDLIYIWRCIVRHGKRWGETSEEKGWGSKIGNVTGVDGRCAFSEITVQASELAMP